MIRYRDHLGKYVYEAAGLGLFMFSAGLFDILIEHPALFTRQHISSGLLRRFLVGLSMGLTALYIFTSPWGKRSGAYINPAVTLVRYRLHQISLGDAVFYMLFQLAGGSLGVLLVYWLMPSLFSHPEINYIVTVPGSAGIIVAFIAESMISCILITTVLATEKHSVLSKYTVYFVAVWITLFISFEAPLSGMSMNPARTFASAVVAGQWTSFWLYCLAPLLGMLAGERLSNYFHKNKSNDKKLKS